MWSSPQMPRKRTKQIENRTSSVNPIRYTWFESPIGPLLLAGADSRLKLVSFAKGKHARQVHPDWIEDASVFAEAIDQLQRYFAGNLETFDLPLLLEGTTFQTKVWTALKNIPYGETVSYKTLAERVGSPKAVRAIGAANGAKWRRCKSVHDLAAGRGFLDESRLRIVFAGGITVQSANGALWALASCQI